jgi:hypothetical protein
LANIIKKVAEQLGESIKVEMVGKELKKKNLYNN